MTEFVAVTMSVKRKRTAYEQKSKILQRPERGEKASKIAQEYNSGKATVSNIKKARQAIEKFINQSALKVKSMKPSKDELTKAIFL
ncbi:hypothetical protein chiPu_0000750 [Chiloscyllium punctatum]|uniref:HTH psq-type domain-containing protein n=1 Tax=Chiloscyllium punctatum TaxID=137246 RepID=A0A401RW51_CHIPU|nr:hypothetical protein [Chiloscyllium punctatum]